MKKHLLTIVLAFVFNVFYAQSTLDKYEGQEGINSILVNKKMFQMMASVKVDSNDKETQQYLGLIKKLDNLKVFTTASTKIAADMKTTADEYKTAADLEEMSNVNSKGENVKIWMKPGTNQSKFSKLLMYNEGSTNGYKMTLMLLEGDFTIKDVSLLIDKMKLPDGAELKRTININ